MTNLHRKRKQGGQSGFTAMEILVAMGLVSLLAAAALASISSMMNGQSQVRRTILVEELTSMAAGLVSDPYVCSLYANGLALTAATALPAVIDSNFKLQSLTTAGALSGVNLLAVGTTEQGVQVTNSRLLATATLGANRYLGELELSFAPTGPIGITMIRHVKLFIGTNGSVVTSCSRVLASVGDDSRGIYSKDCDDFASKGWTSKIACQQDGRWHTVYRNTAAGAAVYGTLADLQLHANEGATVRPSLDGTFAAYTSAQYTCLDFSFVSGVGMCKMGAASGIPDWNGPGDPKNISAFVSTGFLFTTGAFVFGIANCTTPPDPDDIRCAPVRVDIPVEWAIRY